MQSTVRITDSANVTKVSVGAVVLASIELAKQDNIDTFFSGLGSEELFAGYERHEKSILPVNEECWLGLKSMWERDFTRDVAIAKHEKISLMIPFLDRELIIDAMKIPGELKTSRC